MAAAPASSLSTGNQGTVDITASVTGGALGGLLDFRSQVLDPARNDLGRLAAGLAEAMNGQHRAGVDLKGALGTDLFSVGGAVERATRDQRRQRATRGDAHRRVGPYGQRLRTRIHRCGVVDETPRHRRGRDAHRHRHGARSAARRWPVDGGVGHACDGRSRARPPDPRRRFGLRPARLGPDADRGGDADRRIRQRREHGQRDDHARRGARPCQCTIAQHGDTCSSPARRLTPSTAQAASPTRAASQSNSTAGASPSAARRRRAIASRWSTAAVRPATTATCSRWPTR